MGRTDEAIREYKIVAEYSPRFTASRGGGLSAWAEGLVRAGCVKEVEALLHEYDQLLQKYKADERENRSYIAGLVALAKGRPREAVTLFEKGVPLGPPLLRDWRRRWALARALIAAREKDRAVAELVVVVKRAPGGGDPIETYKAMNTLARLYEERGRRDEALALYRRVAHQYREAEPGVKANKEALAGVQRLSKPLP